MKKSEISTILMPTDFSDCAVLAMDFAMHVAKVHHARLILMHVVHPIPEMYGLDKDKATKEQQKELLDARTDQLSTIASMLKEKSGLMVEHLIVVGQIIPSICEIVYTNDVDLVIMGTHGIKGFREFLIGSNTYGITEKCVAPVLSVPFGAKITEFKKIMFPVRNIPNALEKYNFLRTFMGAGAGTLVVYGIYKIDDKELVQVYRRVSDFVRDIKEQWRKVVTTSIITDDNLADEVIERAVEMKCDLIVITSKVDKSITDFFLGKFAQQMINHSTIPVLHIK